MNTPILIGHRGASSELPENTMASFKLAFEKYNLPMIEFDVHTSKDGIPVIIHDARLERTTDQHGYISDFTASELQRMDAGYYFDPEKKGIFPCRGKFSIPLFEELLKNFPNKELSVEIKERSPKLVHAVMALVNHYKAAARCVVGSRYHTTSKTMKEYYPEVRRFASQNEIVMSFFAYKAGEKNPQQDSKLVYSMPLEQCGLAFYEPGFIDFLHRKKASVYFWTINDRNRMQTLAENGADGLITDYPSIACQLFPSA